MAIISGIISAFYIYLLLGTLFGLWFIFKGAKLLDGGMEHASLATKLLLLPGAIGLWPILLRKVFRVR